jgi:hypothetical protein
MTKRKLKVEIIEELKIEVEEFRTKILNVVNDLFLELTDEGYDSSFIVEFKKFDKLDSHHLKKLTIKQIDINNFIDEFSLEFSYNTKLHKYVNRWDSKLKPIDDYTRILNEYFLNIKDVGEYFEYDVFIYTERMFKFYKESNGKKKEV